MKYCDTISIHEATISDESSTIQYDTISIHMATIIAFKSATIGPEKETETL